MRYLNEQLIRDSFLRLRQNEAGGKSGLERTSALMCFLAFDALLHRTSINPPVDFDPEATIGTNNRNAFTREFTRLVQLKNGSIPYQVLNLGEVSIGGTPPEKRLSSNFLTTPMKKASTSQNAFEYPSRPCPVLLLGLQATGISWGMNKHPEWKNNLSVFLQGRKTKTPFTDLAIFVLRQRGIESEATAIQDLLNDGLGEVFTPDLCDYWRRKIALEKVYFVEDKEPYQDAMPTPFDECSWLGDLQPINEAAMLSTRVSYLEGLLRMHHIPFEE